MTFPQSKLGSVVASTNSRVPMTSVASTYTPISRTRRFAGTAQSQAQVHYPQPQGFYCSQVQKLTYHDDGRTKV